MSFSERKYKLSLLEDALSVSKTRLGSLKNEMIDIRQEKIGKEIQIEIEENKITGLKREIDNLNAPTFG